MSAERTWEWPLTDEEFQSWVDSSPWQDAVMAVMNPHQYTLKRRSPDPRRFELMVLHLREHGSQEWFGGAEYTYLEVGGYKYWTMGHALETTILINRKELPGFAKQDKQDGQEEPSEAEALPELYTARYFAENVLSSGVVVPVRISMYPPIIPLNYPVEHEVGALMPERPMIGEWNKFSPMFWKKLDHIGPERIAKELAAISRQHDGKALALLCYEDVTPARGHKCHRVVLSVWWHGVTGWKMPELTDDGEVLELHQLHRQVMPLRPR